MSMVSQPGWASTLSIAYQTHAYRGLPSLSVPISAATRISGSTRARSVHQRLRSLALRKGRGMPTSRRERCLGPLQPRTMAASVPPCSTSRALLGKRGERARYSCSCPSTASTARIRPITADSHGDDRIHGFSQAPCCRSIARHRCLQKKGSPASAGGAGFMWRPRAGPADAGWPSHDRCPRPPGPERLRVKVAAFRGRSARRSSNCGRSSGCRRSRVLPDADGHEQRPGAVADRHGGRLERSPRSGRIATSQ